MSLSNKPTEDELINLIDRTVAEGKLIDYKLKLSVSNDEDKKEFLADVVSFANTLGGHLVIGMKEEKGVPIELIGIPIDDADKTKLRLEEIIRDGISQRIAGIAIHIVHLKNGNWAIVIYVPKSWSAPHMVSFKRSSRFYARNSAGKYQLDVQEMRQAFLLSESLEQRIRDFRLDRIAKIGAGDTPVILNNYPKIVLHTIPLSGYQNFQTLEVSSIPMQFLKHSQEIMLSQYRFNLDGVLFFHATSTDKLNLRYKQVFRNGNFEYVNADIISPWESREGKVIDIPSKAFELELMKATQGALSFQKAIGIEPPVYVFISFVGVKGLRIGTDASVMAAYHNSGIDRDLLLIPEMVFEAYPSDLHQVATLLKPAFDAVWNAAGWPNSINYNEDGAWVPNR